MNQCLFLFAYLFEIWCSWTSFPRMECPVCLIAPSKSPIYHCANGHVVCKGCVEKLRKNCPCPKCPVCRDHRGFFRCLATEKLILESGGQVFPRLHAGCYNILSPKHEEECCFCKVYCPVLQCQGKFPLNVEDLLSKRRKESYIDAKTLQVAAYTLNNFCTLTNIIYCMFALNLNCFVR